MPEKNNAGNVSLMLQLHPEDYTLLKSAAEPSGQEVEDMICLAGYLFAKEVLDPSCKTLKNYPL